MENIEQFNLLQNMNNTKKIPILNLPESEVIAIIGQDYYNEISSKKIS